MTLVPEVESAIEAATRSAFRTGYLAAQLAAIKSVNTIKCGTQIENLLLLTVMRGIEALVPPVPAVKP